jgi:hypothetical protein
MARAQRLARERARRGRAARHAGPVADTEGASWSVYRGPVWIALDVPAKYRIDEKEPDEPVRADEIVVEKVEVGACEISSPGCDHTSEMKERVMKTACPRLHRVLYAGDEEPSEGELKEAVHAELQRLVNANWRKAARGKRTDLIGQIARQMAAPVCQIENILRQSGQLEEPPSPPRAGEIRKIRSTTRRPRRSRK